MGRTRKADKPAQEAAAPVPPPPPPPPPKPPAAPLTRRAVVWRWLWQFVFPLLLGAALLGAVLWGGAKARDLLREQDPRLLAFADLECDPPPGLTRRQFLDEAQYLAQLPDRLELLDPDVATRITRALEAHPWVDRVERVVLPPEGPRAVLRYREPALAVARPPRVVDRKGVLLPTSAGREGLPVFTEALPAPGQPGKPWGGLRVKAAARVAGLVGPHLKPLGLAGCEVEVLNNEVTLRGKALVVRWGRAPGQEGPGEPTGKVKLQRLLGQKWPAGAEVDLRPLAGARSVVRK